METRIRDLEEQNVQYQEQNVQYQEQNVQYQEQNVQYQERLANLEDERKRLVQSNNDLKEELEGYKERLLHVFFTVEERRVGSISDTPKPGLVRLDKTVVDAILSCCLSRDLTTSRGKVRDAIASFLSAERCVAKQRETTKAKKAREVQAKCGAAKKTDSARKKKKRE
nr:hypothetical protein BaRGS_010474 [Batillaria attramentaria]